MDEPESFIAHKFKPISDQLLKTLEANEIYFAPPASLNDPFDCQIDLGRARKLAQSSQGIVLTRMEDERWEAFARNLSQKVRTCGVFSLSGGEVVGPNSHLFWPHYGDEHKGICLTYRIPTSFIKKNDLGIDRVKYSTEGLFKAIVEFKIDPIPPMEDLQPLMVAMLTTKAGAWAYEEEVRMVSANPGPVSLPPGCLVQVCFGLRVAPSERQRLMTLIEGWGYKDCIFAETYIADDGLFNLAIRQLPTTNA
jgi:hypothetical protein